MLDQTTARQQIADLTRRYASMPEGRRAALNENELRHSFILPLFSALGWDISDPDEMTSEEQISRKKVDFGFYVRRIPAFYLETKRQSAGVDHPEFVRQAISYSWLKGVTWAVLTNFERLRVFNAVADAAPERARFIDLHWTDYAGDGFDDLWLLSKPAMSDPARPIVKRAERNGVLTPRRPVTELLFKNLTDWRTALFNQFQKFMPPAAPYATHDVDNAVQRLIDRLIFLRAVEDRGIEEPILQPILRQYRHGEWWSVLKAKFREMNTVYNSNLFRPDVLDELDMHDPDLLESIINGLYRINQNAQFDFNAIDADVLGAAYEQYLGHKQRVDGTLTAETSARRSKRQQQGIFYTPKPIVRYIIDQTVGRRLRAGADPYALRILDPACGSGSFLIAAFDVLDRWLAQHDRDTAPAVRRRRLLTECLFGVDLDDQAVEVTRLNLILRASLERARLPLLTHIQHGDSLTDDAAISRHAFAWQTRFASVMDAGGFDVVVGNPPYVRAERLSAEFKTYAAQHYETAAGSADLYVYFMEKSLKLLRPEGVYGVIVANRWLKAGYGDKLRRFLSPHIHELVDFGELPVFEDAATFPAIVIADRTPPTTPLAMTNVKTLEYVELGDYLAEQRYNVARSQISGAHWTLTPSQRAEVLTKIKAAGVPLSEYIAPARIRYGIKTGYNEAFIISGAVRKRLIDKDGTSAEVIKPFVVGDNVRKYHINSEDKYVIFMGRGKNIEDYPAIRDYLLPFKDRLTPRPAGHNGVWNGRKAGSYQWYETQDPVNYHNEFEQPKIMYPVICSTPRFTFDTTSIYPNDKTFVIPVRDLYLLGVLNTRVIWSYLQSISASLGDPDQGGRLELREIYMRTVPIVRAAADDPRRVRITALVTDRLRLAREAADLVIPDPDLSAHMDEIDGAIDRLVADLYGLTPAEVSAL